jgi:hypothetical protein
MSSTTAPPQAQTSEDAGVAECRVWPRHPCDVPVHCQPAAARTDNDHTWPGTIRDVSQGGLGLVLQRRFEPGTVLFIELPGTDSRPLLARVVHAARLAQGSWLLGCTFSSKLSEDEVRRLLAARGGQDRPASAEPVAGSAGRGVVIPDVMLQGSVGATGRVVRRTVRWLKLPETWPPVPGMLLAVGSQGRVVNPAGDRLRVVRCTTRDDGGWILTYEFAGQPSPEVLHLLGYQESDSR